MKVITDIEFNKLVKRRAKLFDEWADDPKHKDYEEFLKLTTIILYLEGVR